MGLLRLLGLFACEAFLKLLDAHVPQPDSYRPATIVPHSNSIMRMLAGAAAAVVVLFLAIWTTVWLTINLL